MSYRECLSILIRTTSELIWISSTFDADSVELVVLWVKAFVREIFEAYPVISTNGSDYNLAIAWQLTFDLDMSTDVILTIFVLLVDYSAFFDF